MSYTFFVRSDPLWIVLLGTQASDSRSGVDGEFVLRPVPEAKDCDGPVETATGTPQYPKTMGRLCRIETMSKVAGEVLQLDILAGERFREP